MPHSNICMWTDYITGNESSGEKFHLANDASVCPTCPTTPAHATRCPREREYEKRSRQRDCPLSGAFPDRHGQYVRKGRVGRSGGRSAPCTSASSVLPTTADQLAYLPTRLPIFRIADTHLHTGRKPSSRDSRGETLRLGFTRAADVRH